ncbi:hypothetical protein SKAU_G00233170 [Synaphobranchus kaupii]|uniref:Uncharacterized protein n=1 Tax=Synaphobranchus kaupii TaxID=118154 RepID=A0A9Q1F626_SYNKA|nr:hypothetical protein SKAU_G00233170 [Synaphobranchus kaupii]
MGRVGGRWIRLSSQILFIESGGCDATAACLMLLGSHALEKIPLAEGRGEQWGDRGLGLGLGLPGSDRDSLWAPPHPGMSSPGTGSRHSATHNARCCSRALGLVMSPDTPSPSEPSPWQHCHP